MPTPPPPGDVPSCAEGGVLGVLPGTLGCLQATEAMKLLLGHTDGLLSGRLLVVDAMTMRFSEAKLNRLPDREPITELIDYKGFCGGPKEAKAEKGSPSDKGGRTMDEAESSSDESTDELGYETITPKECVAKLVNDGWSPWVLDVRLQSENDIVCLPFTDKVVPHRSVHDTDIPVDGDVLVYCKAGVRGKKACLKLINEYNVEPNRLYNLDGGVMRWQTDIDPSMPRY